MTELLTHPTPGLSATTRLVARALIVIERCGCSAEDRRAVVLRSFDGGSRRRAGQIRARLRRDGAVPAVDAAVPVLALDPARQRDRHMCAYVDCNDGTGEAERIAALTHTPLVALPPPGQGPEPARSGLARPALRAHFTSSSGGSGARPFPSTTGRVPDVAFDTFLIAPNQPEAGKLDVRVGEVGRRALDPGTSVSLRCLPEAILVEAIDPRGQAVTWLGDRVEVRQHSGIHRIYRDGLCVTDLSDAVVVEHDPEAVRRFDG